MTHTFAQAFRQHFPILTSKINGDPLVYFDNGATTQKPLAVINEYQRFYYQDNANVHRASHALSAKSTKVFEQARENVKKFINANTIEEIIWTKGTTESVNLIAQSWGRVNLKPGDEIVLTVSEHHANIVPWQLIAEQTGADIKVLELTTEGRIDETKLNEVITSKTKVVSCGHISNVLGRINPIEALIKRAKEVGAVSVIDGAQAVGHMPINVQQLGCDFYVFSAHKMYGPTGVGILYGKKHLLERMPPYQGGGEMIKKVSFKETSFNRLPFKFEAGTPNIAGIVAFSQALAFINKQRLPAIAKYENELLQYALVKLQKISAVKFIVDGAPDIPLIAFTVDGHHNHDIAASLDAYGIAVRSGHHCAMPLMQYLNIDGCIRLSMAAYNTFEEIDYFIEKLIHIIDEHEPLSQTSKRIEQDENKTQDKTQVNSDMPRQNTTLAEHSFANVTVEELVHLFGKAKGWDTKHRQIMLLGKSLERMDKQYRNDKTLISGCESLAWVSVQQDQNRQYQISADSNARVIRGLLAIILAAFNNKTAEQINSFDIEGYFEKLGLLQHLSPSRGNGVKAIVAKIYQLIV